MEKRVDSARTHCLHLHHDLQAKSVARRLLELYRVIGLLNHVYKILSVILLDRIVEECGRFFSEW